MFRGCQDGSWLTFANISWFLLVFHVYFGKYPVPNGILIKKLQPLALSLRFWPGNPPVETAFPGHFRFAGAVGLTAPPGFASTTPFHSKISDERVNIILRKQIACGLFWPWFKWIENMFTWRYCQLTTMMIFWMVLSLKNASSQLNYCTSSSLGFSKVTSIV